MKRFVLALACLCAVPVALGQAVPSASVPPPPGMDDPGVQPRPATSGTRLAPDLPGHAVSGQPLPQVKVHREADQTIEEYSRNGRVYMVVITPKNGIQQTYMTDPEGRLVDEHGKKPPRPVMYKIIEWGKSRPPGAASAAGD